MIDFDIRSNIEAIPEYLDEMKSRTVVAAAKATINKTLLSTRKITIKRLGLTYKLKPSGLSKKEVKAGLRLIKAKTGPLHTLEGVMTLRGQPIPIIKFISGAKNTIKQKGIKIQKRRKLKAEIRPGKKIILKKAFIQKVRSIKVFKRGKGEKDFKNQAVASVALIIMRTPNGNAILTHISRRFNKVFANQMQFRLDKLALKLKNKPLKKVR